MSHAIWIGDSVTQGAGATSAAKRYSTLTSQNLNLTEHNYATANTGYTTPDATGNFTTQLDTAIADTSYPHNQTGYVFLMGGLNDTYSAIAAMQQAVAGLIAKAEAAYPNARIVVGVGPGCILDSADDDAIAEQGHVLAAIRLAATNADALVIPDMRSICGTDPSLHANGINPNDDGHELLAKAVEAAIIADRGEPEDAPVADLQRIYVSQGVDQFAREVNARRKREAAKNEANRPTGTELTQLTSKLDMLTQIQALQQIILQQQQAILQQQQKALEDAQGKLAEQQKALEDAQGKLAEQQNTLTDQQRQLSDIVAQLQGVVGSQGDTVDSLKAITEHLTSQQDYMQHLVSYTYDEFVHLGYVLAGSNIIYSPRTPPEF
jgi:lysophospholipase L1-like esterase